MLGAFRAHYRNSSLGHSYKTNYIPQLCRAAYADGAYAEVVSRMEYDLALRLGADPQRIILNGPVKDPALLREALRSSVILNVDSLQELQQVAELAGTEPQRTFPLGLRLNFSLPGSPRSRFGIDAESNDLRVAMDLLATAPNLQLRGIHCHLGGDRTAPAYAHRASRMVELARDIFPDAPPDFIDIGGGFAGGLAPGLAAQLPYTVPSMAEYAAAVAGTLAKAYGPTGGPELIVEPGMGVLSDTGHFVCRVAATKRIGGTHHAITTGSIYNIKPTLNKYDLPVQAFHAPDSHGEEASWVLSGYTCMEIDIMHSGWRGRLAPGDLLAFGNVGAYAVVLKPPFIKPAPAILALQADGSLTEVKRAETLDDVMATYRW